MGAAKRLGLILGGLALIGAAIFVVGERLRAPAHGAGHVGVLHQVRAAAPALARPQGGRALADDAVPAPGTRRRTLAGYYALRAYPGAPPIVPHAVEADFDRRQRCNVCHLKGGFVPKFNAYTPVTPHPEMANCLQCHAQANAAGVFEDSQWRSLKRPRIGRPALPGGPPPIPHSLQMRRQCLTCHAGPAAVVEVRTSHPERLNCLQCHVPRTTDAVFGRIGAGS